LRQLRVQSSLGGEFVADWYYIGHYGQLGPLTREQIDELINGGVIARETYVWYTGMNDWVPADRCPDLVTMFAVVAPSAPPPPPGPRLDAPQAAPKPYGVDATYGAAPAPVSQYGMPSPYMGYQPVFSAVRSDKSRAVGGILNLIIPGVGRMYLGYGAMGVLQFMLAFCGGVGLVWSFIDGILILTGTVKMDGFGRELPE
jgi:TM2 domain-containing membrane protein YozV